MSTAVHYQLVVDRGGPRSPTDPKSAASHRGDGVLGAAAAAAGAVAGRRGRRPRAAGARARLPAAAALAARALPARGRCRLPCGRARALPARVAARGGRAVVRARVRRRRGEPHEPLHVLGLGLERPPGAARLGRGHPRLDRDLQRSRLPHPPAAQRAQGLPAARAHGAIDDRHADAQHPQAPQPHGRVQQGCTPTAGRDQLAARVREGQAEGRADRDLVRANATRQVGSFSAGCLPSRIRCRHAVVRPSSGRSDAQPRALLPRH